MDMEQIRKDSLITKARLFGKLWGNQQLQDMVCQAITNSDMDALFDIIDTLATKANKQQEMICKQNSTIEELQEILKEADNFLSEHQQSSGTLIEPPAKRTDLETQRMWTLYQQLGSFNKVGEVMGCAGKTVSRRLRAEGYIE